MMSCGQREGQAACYEKDNRKPSPHGDDSNTDAQRRKKDSNTGGV
jgi:hypothetical protein